MDNIVILWDTAYDKGHLLKRHRKKHAGGGGGLQNKVLYGVQPVLYGIQPCTLLCTNFDSKCTLLLYLLLTNGTPFTYLIYNFVSLYFKCAVFKLWIQITTFSRLFHSHKMHLLTLWTFLQTEMTYFPVLSYTSTRPVPFHIPEPWKKKVLLSGGASV